MLSVDDALGDGIPESDQFPMNVHSGLTSSTAVVLETGAVMFTVHEPVKLYSGMTLRDSVAVAHERTSEDEGRGPT
jgi:hypothetical protein